MHGLPVFITVPITMESGNEYEQNVALRQRLVRTFARAGVRVDGQWPTASPKWMSSVRCTSFHLEKQRLAGYWEEPNF